MTTTPDRRGLRGPILTIDGSLSQTGWALTGENGRRLQSGVFRSKAGLPADQRIYIIGQQLMRLWPRLQKHPRHFGIEHQFFRAAAPGAKFQLRPEVVADLCRLEGVLIFIAKNAFPDIGVMALRSTEWRGLLGVTGKQTEKEKRDLGTLGMKERGLIEVNRRRRESGSCEGAVNRMYDDEIEAIGLGMAIHYELTNGYPMHTRRGELKEEKRARKARAKLPKNVCGICHTRIVRGGIALDTGLLTGPALVHAKCRPRPAGGKK